MIRIGSLYEVLISGAFEKIVATFDPSQKISLSLAEYIRIEKNWYKMKKSSPSMYNGSLPRLLSFHVSGNCLFLNLGLTSFKEYLGTNELLSEQHNIGESHLANPLCVRVLSGSIAKLHVKPSGHLVTTTRSLLQKPRKLIHYPMDEAVRQEAHEELALIENETSDFVCTGLVVSLQNRKPELTFMMQTPVSSNEIISRPKDHGWESDALLAIPYEPDSIMQLLVDKIYEFTAPGHAAIFLAACKDFGNSWKNSFLTSLSKKNLI